MENKRFLTAQDVMEMLGVSLSYSYKLIRRLNAEREADGFVTIKGRVSTQYFMKRIYGLSTDKKVIFFMTRKVDVMISDLEWNHIMVVCIVESVLK